MKMNYESDIVFYGERGIVNGIILDIKDDIEKLKAFLRSIRFAEGGLPWIDELKTVTWYVEPSLSQFGDPDIILVAVTDTKKYVFFIEAKKVTYTEASVEIDRERLIPNNHENNASRLNIQLALKYRFMRAFEKSTGKEIIKETGKTRVEYGDSRKGIENEVIIEYCKNIFSGAEAIYFIAMTNDNKDTLPFNNELYLPAINRRNWEEDKGLFGLVSYNMLETVVWKNSDGDSIEGIISKENGYYGSAAKRLNIYPPEVVDDNIFSTLPKTKAIKKWSEKQRELSGFANKYIKAYELAGSYSKVVGNITVMKIQADPKNRQGILVCFSHEGLSDDIERLPGETYLIGVGLKKKAFYCCSVSSKKDIKALRPSIKSFISSFELKMEMV